MILRKINAAVSLVTTLLLLNHAAAHGLWMLTGRSFIKSAASIPWILFGLMMAHAIISIVLAFLGHKGAEKRKCNGYAKLNVGTNIQRFSGLLLIVLTVLHILGTVGILTPPDAVHKVLPPVFFAIVLMHAAISTGKAFITLGIGNAKFFKVADVAAKVICGLTLAIDIVGFYRYFG